jgi:hypothetical protein
MCNNLPLVEQIFGKLKYRVGLDDPCQCVVFVGDTMYGNGDFYGVTIGPGPSVDACTAIMNDGVCIFITIIPSGLVIIAILSSMYITYICK